jgi:hypothetical protein
LSKVHTLKFAISATIGAVSLVTSVPAIGPSITTEGEWEAGWVLAWYRVRAGQLVILTYFNFTFLSSAVQHTGQTGAGLTFVIDEY